MRRLLPVLLAALPALAACGNDCGDFDDVDVLGGTAEQRGVVMNALRDFARWSARDTICASHISVEDDIRVEGLDGTVLGRYDAGSGSIAVLGEQPFLYDTVIHELCHAVDFQDDISIAFPQLFELAPFYQVAGRRDPESVRREALALDCEVGPEALSLALEVSRTCEQPVVHERASVLLHLIYPGADTSVPTAPLERLPVGSVDLPSHFVPLGQHPIGTTSRGQIVLLGAISGVAAAIGIDPVSGTVEAAGGNFDFSPMEVETPARLRQAGAVELGSGTVTSIRWPLASGDVLRFLAVRGDDGWSLPPEPCLGPASWVVTPDGLPLLVELDEDSLHWSMLDLP